MSGAPNYYSRNPDPRANYDQAPLNDLGKLENHFSDDEVKVDSKQILDTNISNVSFKNECMWSNCILEWLNLCFCPHFSKEDDVWIWRFHGALGANVGLDEHIDKGLYHPIGMDFLVIAIIWY